MTRPVMEQEITSGEQLTALADALGGAGGADRDIDQLISRAFEIELADFTSSAETARHLVAQVMPRATLRVGYDVRGVLPSATVTQGRLSDTVVAPTVPLAILQALLSVLSRSLDERSRAH